MGRIQVLELPIRGMDCAECAAHVQKEIARLDGVTRVDVLLAAEKAIVKLDVDRVAMADLRRAVADAGDYSVPETVPAAALAKRAKGFNRRLMVVLGIVFAVVLSVVIAGEWLGLFDRLTELVPYPIGLALVIVSGWPVFRNVIRAALKRKITSHTLMTVGVIAALLVGQWVTAAIVVIFMRVGDYVENFTTESARRAVKELTAATPQKARVERDGQESEVPVDQVQVGEIVIVRPGEKIPVDGEVVAGHATVDQSAITGESMPAEVASGSQVFAATVARLGFLRIRTLRAGSDTTFGQVIRMVEEAETHRADVQRLADRFSAYYLPIVATIAAVTFAVGRNPLSTAAVLVVACSCSFALATPVAMLAAIGSGAKRGLLIKGGKYLETLARADVVLVDKTGTLTLGQPQITDVIPLNGLSAVDTLKLAASAERYSEHPLAEAMRAAARADNIGLSEPEDFEAIPGTGVRARVDETLVEIGNRRIACGTDKLQLADELERQGKTLLFLTCNGEPAAVFAAADTLRPEVPAAIGELRRLGIRHIELLTGDNERTASELAGKLRVEYRAGLLPRDKIEIVRGYQSKGRTVVMVGDGVNDAPALAQADIGIAMGAAGSHIAIEAAQIALMREDWHLVPEVIRVARRTMNTVRMNLVLTGVYNVVGLALAAFGILPPVFAAAAQSLPDIGILANSARLLRPSRSRSKM